MTVVFVHRATRMQRAAACGACVKWLCPTCSAALCECTAGVTQPYLPPPCTPVMSWPERVSRSQSTWLKPFSRGILLRRPAATTCTPPHTSHRIPNGQSPLLAACAMQHAAWAPRAVDAAACTHMLA